MVAAGAVVVATGATLVAMVAVAVAGAAAVAAGAAMVAVVAAGAWNLLLLKNLRWSRFRPEITTQLLNRN